MFTTKETVTYFPLTTVSASWLNPCAPPMKTGAVLKGGVWKTPQQLLPQGLPTPSAQAVKAAAQIFN